MSAAAAASEHSFKIKDLFTQAIADWDKHLEVCASYAAANQRTVDWAAATKTEFRAYAKALTQLIWPYSFSKKASDYFHDDGYFDFHGPGGPERGAGGTRSRIGSVDYWAAALIDPVFKDLCRQRVRLTDKIYGKDVTSPESRSYHLRIQDDNSAAPELHHRWDDLPQGSLRMFNNLLMELAGAPSIMYRNASIADVGALYRLNRQLAHRFAALMGSPETHRAVYHARECFMNAYKMQVFKEFDTGKYAVNVLKNDPAKNPEPEKRLHQLAYLERLGYETVDVTDGVEAGIEKAVAAAKYADGKEAPGFEMDFDRSPLGASIDRLLYEEKGIKRLTGSTHEAALPLDELATYCVMENDRSPAVPEQPKRFIRDLVAEASPQPRG